MVSAVIEGRKVDVKDALCPYRPCLHVHEWRGTYTPGRGYTYAPQSQWYWHCQHRAEHGCPDVIPEPDPEKARCCHLPRVRKAKPDRYGRLPRKQRCLTCRTWLAGYALELARTAPLPELHPCRHDQAEPSLFRDWIECTGWKGGCGGMWDHRPAPHELPQADFDEIVERTEGEA